MLPSSSWNLTLSNLAGSMGLRRREACRRGKGTGSRAPAVFLFHIGVDLAFLHPFHGTIMMPSFSHGDRGQIRVHFEGDCGVLEILGEEFEMILPYCLATSASIRSRSAAAAEEIRQQRASEELMRSFFKFMMCKTGLIVRRLTEVNGIQGILLSHNPRPFQQGERFFLFFQRASPGETADEFENFLGSDVFGLPSSAATVPWFLPATSK